MDIGIIGLGDMGKPYAREFARKGHTVYGCDVSSKRSQLESELAGTGVNILDDGIAVSRRSDLIIYSVEAHNIGEAAARYGPSTKPGAIVSGQTSVKTPEIEAFEKYLPKDVSIIPIHSLHGPSVAMKGQTMVVVNHRSSPEAYNRGLEAFSSLGSNIVEIPNYSDHDRITADTQVLTHLAFESMGTGWKNAGFFPWENTSYVGGIDNVKILMALRIYGGKAHVYSGLALLNPFAKPQVVQYAQSESELFKLMIKGEERAFVDRIKKASQFVFNDNDSQILLDDVVMGEFSLGRQKERTPNSHLSLLAMVDAWHKLGINPYAHMICQTPVFRLRLGIAEYLFKNPSLIEESLDAALHNKSIQGDDLEFHTAVHEWAATINHGDVAGYQQQFDATRSFFKDRIPEGMKRSNELIARLSHRE
jgi:prephenate dehydrogenase (NADP+)